MEQQHIFNGGHVPFRYCAFLRRALAMIILAGVLLFEAELSATEYYAAPAGTANGSGSVSDPWDLHEAFDNLLVGPGDTIWLRGGIYRENNRVTKFISKLQGTSAQPIIVRQFPGERATIDGNIMQTHGGYVNYWGFEIMDSHPNRTSNEVGPFPTTFRVDYDGNLTDLAISGFDLRAPGVKLINLVIHDCIGGGIGLNTNAANSEVYGNICYYNGWQGCDRGHGHGIYAQNVDPSEVRIEENIFHGNYALGVQLTGNDSLSDNFHLEGNIMFLNGSIAREHQANFLLGSFLGTSKAPVLIRNFIYDTQGSTDSDANIGYAGGSLGGIVVSNYFQTSVHFSEQNSALTLENNIFLSNTIHLERAEYPDNLYLAGTALTNLVEVRTNKYEPGRANIIIYNWEHKTQIEVQVSSFLTTGTNFDVRNAQDFFGAPVLSGTYQGGPLTLPMTNLMVAKPIGTNAPPASAPNFAMFVLLPRSGQAPLSNTPPFLSTIDNQVTDENVSTAPAYFSGGDVETPFNYLSFSVHSSNPGLIPHANIILHSTSETNRSVIVIPQRNENGTATITLTLGDGLLATSTSFSVTVNPGIDLPSESRKTNIAKGMISLEMRDDKTAFLQFQCSSGDRYALQASDDLTEWEYIGAATAECGGMLEFEDANASLKTARFYRFHLLPPIDSSP